MQPGKVVSKRIEIDAELLRQFDELFPGQSYWVVINKMFAYLIQAKLANPINITLEAANNLEKELTNGHNNSTSNKNIP